jgi:O-antigen/teichoic acid export membrane protein
VQIARNYLAGLSNSAWSAVVTLAVVPFYLKYLGIEAYGLIGFLVFTQGVVSLLDLGLAPTINREVARCTAQGDILKASQLLHTLAVIYWSMAALIFGVFVLAAPLIAHRWLSTSSLSPDVVATATSLIGLVIACRWPLGLYQGVLVGAQRLTYSSVINIAMTTATSIGAVAILAFVSPTIEALFLWQGAVAFVFSLVMRRAAWSVIGGAAPKTFSWTRLREVWRFSAGMSLVAVTAIVLLQLDKGILSSMLSLEQFGQYMLAVLIANSLYVLLRPLFNTIYPRMTALVATAQTQRLTDFYLSGTRLLASVLFPLAAAISFYAYDLVFVWTGNAGTAASVAPIVALFVWGTALNGVMNFPYALQLAFGRTRLPLTINVLLIAVSAPITVILTWTHGVVGGAASWAILNAIYLLFGTWLTHRLLLQGIGARWLGAVVLVPLVLSLLVVGAAAWSMRSEPVSEWLRLGLAGIATLVAVAINVSLDRAAADRFLRSLGLADVLKLNA